MSMILFMGLHLSFPKSGIYAAIFTTVKLVLVSTLKSEGSRALQEVIFYVTTCLEILFALY